MKRIVLADDNAVVRHMLRKIFEESGWTCAEASNGEEAIAKVQELKPDVAILDLSMPVMNGLVAGKVLKETSPKSRLILFTSYGNLLSSFDLQSAGFSALIPKEAAGKLLMTAHQLLDAV